jgi:hypothetical protein
VTDPIEPALSDEQWAQLAKATADGMAGMSHNVPIAPSTEAWRWVVDGEVGHSLRSTVDVEGGYPLESDAAPAILALANWQLPDDSPYKITRADVDHIEWVAEQMRKLNPISIDDEMTLTRIAAKLTALLPPNE